MSRRLSVDDLNRLFGITFTDEQLAAITAPLEPGVVIAGAGSGKTTVMAARVLWLVVHEDVAPHEVLGLTFTNKAAASLSRRVRDALADGTSHFTDDADLVPTVLTYHAYAGRLLRDHGLRLGFEPGARLITEASRYQLAEHTVRQIDYSLADIDRAPATVVKYVLELEAELNEHLVTTDEVADFVEQFLADVDATPKVQAKLRDACQVARSRRQLLPLVDVYRREKRARMVLDFGDQMAAAARLAEGVPDVATREREAFPVVLLDEYQDTSITQARLLRALFGDGHPVTAVGDPFQGIYGWRGASIANISGFASQFRPAASPPRDATTFTLRQNNRSGSNLLAVANAVSAPLREVLPDVAPLVPRDDLIGAGVTRVGLFDTAQHEVDFVAQDIAQRVTGTSPMPAGDVAVLVRVTADIGPLHAALTERDVPVEVVGLSGLLELPEVADVVATLRVIDDPTANAALVRLLSGPRWRIGPRDLALLARRAHDLGQPASSARLSSREERGDDPDQALLDAVAGADPAEILSLSEALADPGDLNYDLQARRRFRLLADELEVLRRSVGQPVATLAHRVAGAMGLFVEVAANARGARAQRMAALTQFLDVAAGFTDLDADPSLSAFLAYLDAAQQYERGIDAALPSSGNSVKLMTIHKAKGLEWPVVYVPDLTATVFPPSRSRSSWLTSPSVLPFPLRGDASDFPQLTDTTTKGITGYHQAVKARELLEERRLAYVAITRAEREVVATGHWWGLTQAHRRGPSVFLSDIADHLREHPEHGRIEVWTPEPAPGRNPALAVHEEHPWPRPLDAVHLRSRMRAAELVREAIDTPSLLVTPPAAIAEREQADAWSADVAVLVAELERSREAVHDVPVPRRLSATMALRWQADPQGFARELARPLPRPPSPPARRGSAFHRWVQARFTQAALLDLDDLESSDDTPLDDDLRALQQAFLAGPFADRVPLAVEAPFELSLAGHVVAGRIDAVYAVGNGSGTGYEVVDWKTGRGDADPLQLAIYRAAWAALVACPLEQVDATFYVVPTGRVQRVAELPGLAELAAQFAVATVRA